MVLFKLETALVNRVVGQAENLSPVLGEIARVHLTLSLNQHWDKAGMPVIGNNDDVIAVRKASKGKLFDRHESTLAKVRKAGLVVDIVLTKLRAIQLGARQAPDCGQEAGMIHKDLINLLLEGVEEMHRLLLATHVYSAPEACVPCIS